MIIRKGPRRSSASHVPATSSPRRSLTSASTSSPGITTGELDEIAGAFIAAHGGASASKGYHGASRRDLHLAERDGRPRHPGPYRVAGRRPDHDRRRRRARRRDRRQRLHLRRRGDRREAQRLLDVCQDALAAGIAEARPATGSATSPTPCRRSSRAPASRSCAASSGTASAATTTRIRTCRTSASRAGARGSREGMTIAIEPMITVGTPDVYVHDGRLVDLDRGRVARGAFRAHGRDHGRAGPGS